MMLSRDVFETEDYLVGKFTHREALFDLFYLAAFKDRTFKIRGITVEQKVGQVAKSLRDLAVRWQWSVGTVKRFIDELESDGIIGTQKSSVIQIVTIKKYLICGTQNETQIDTQNETKIDTQIDTPYNKDNKYINKKESTNVLKKSESISELEKQFEDFRLKYKSYGGKVRGFQVEIDELKKKHKDWKDVIPMLSYAIDKENNERNAALRRGEFFPQIKNLKTYLNQRSWECYTDGYEKYNPDEYHPQDMEFDSKFNAYRFYGLQPEGYLFDGYDDDNRPDGARVVSQFFVWEWRKMTKQWEQVK